MILHMLLLIHLLIFVKPLHAKPCPRYCECDFKLTLVYCFDGGLNATHFYKIIQLLSDNLIELHIHAPKERPNYFKWNDNLNRFTKLQRISLINCNIPAISQRVRIKSLVSLNLQHNSIDAIQMDSFKGLPALEHLDLSYNRISVLPSGCFVYLRSLNTLSLSHNHVRDLPSNLFYGPEAVQHLEFDGLQVPVEQINRLLESLPTLERLELNHCNLGDQSISHLRLRMVSKLVRLGLGGNNLTVIPSHKLRELPYLQTVDLSNNKIRKLPACSFCSCNITEIYLGHNLLGIDDNSMTIESFAHVDIRRLDLSFNFFDNFNSKLLFRIKHSIRSLYLSGNALSTPKKNLIEDLPNLNELHLAYNHIEHLPNTWPIEYSSLRYLNLSSNHIRYIAPSFTNSLPFLKVLDISSNEITYLDTYITDFLTETSERVYLHNNPWDCRCANGGIQKYLKRKKHILPVNELAMCATPEHLRNLRVDKVEKMSECALILGGTYELTQMGELGILLSGVILISTVIGGFLLIIMIIMRRKTRVKRSKYIRSNGHQPFVKEAITLPLKTLFKDEETRDLPPPLQPLTTFGHV